MEVPTLMRLAMNLLVYIKQEAQWITYSIETIYSFHIILRITLPCIINEMVNAQVEAIKITLHNKIFTEADERKNNETQRFLQYIETRRLQRKVWRVIPVDLQLPLSVFSMCITYLIVIVQFSHLYD
ncbi:uncharacterized protein LOC126368747 isoform X4 [Pectinophora gossypiella]|nr:uncharacterized protein LOC126368747 isoform X4 [Pectinophora gossypiella]